MRRRATDGSRSKVLLVSVLLSAVVTAGCGQAEDTAAWAAAHARASDLPPVATHLPVPPVATPPEALPSVTTSPEIVPPRDVSPEVVPPRDVSPEPTSEPESASLTRAAPMSAVAPVRLQIPSIGVDSTLMDLGLQADGSLEVPPGGFPAGWYTGAPTPGELGPAIIAGHVDWAGKPGVFFDLRDLSSGDVIAITRADGSTARFRVARIERFAKDAFPTDAVYGDLDHAGLRLITCGGAFDRQARSYRDNLVVFAELIGRDRPGD